MVLALVGDSTITKVDILIYNYLSLATISILLLFSKISAEINFTFCVFR